MSGGTSFGEDDHSVSHISRALGSEDTMLQRVESPPVDWSEEEVEEKISIPRVTRGKDRVAAFASHVSRTKTSKSSTRPSRRPMFEESTLAGEDLSWIKMRYNVLDEFHLWLLRADERV